MEQQKIEEQTLNTKGELRKIFREDSKWSMGSIVVTALTGVSVAFISTQLTSLFNSILLIAVMAFVTATVSEFYRIFVALTSLGAKRAAEKATASVPRAVEGSKAPEQPNGESEGELEEDPVTEAISVVTSAYRLEPQQESQHPNIWKRGLFRTKNYSKANPFFWLIFLFIGVSLLTVGGSYIVSNGKPQIINRTVEVKEELSQQDQQKLIDEAVAKAVAQDPAVPEVPWSDIEQMKEQLAILSESSSNLELSLQELRGELEGQKLSGSSADSDLLAKLSVLESQRAELATKVEELEAKLAESEPTQDSQSNPETSVN